MSAEVFQQKTTLFLCEIVQKLIRLGYETHFFCINITVQLNMPNWPVGWFLCGGTEYQYKS